MLKKHHERCPSECGNETISVDMRDDDAEVKVCVDQNDKSGGNNLKSFEIFLWIGKTIEETKRSSPLLQKTTKSTRKLRKKMVPYTPIVKLKKEEHCICYVNYQNVDDRRMIQCQNC